MPRRYVNVTAARDPNEVLAKVRTWVRLLRCGDVIPVVYFSKKVYKDYFVFLGYETFSKEDLPDAVIQLCEKAGFTGQLLKPLDFDELRKFLDTQEFDTTGSDRIPYRARWLGDTGDVLDFADAVFDTPAAASDPNKDEKYEKLLAWLTASGGGRWETFVKACSVIGVAENAPAAKAVFRRLALLGHIEASEDAREWVVSPPVFVRSAADPNVAFWCGQRTLSWRDSLRGSLQAEITPQPLSKAPPRFSLCEDSAERIYEALKSLETPFEWQEEPLATVLAAHLPDLDRWEECLPSLPGLTNPEHAERWQANGYVKDEEFHIRDGRFIGPSGLYRVSRGEGRKKIQLTFYFDEPQQLIRRGDWFGLRFLAQHRAGRLAAACWSPDCGGKLIIRANERWPALYERALVLASGVLPGQSQSGLLLYEGISFGLAQALTGRLGVTLEKNDA